jgi:hypothetical protein
MPEHNSNTESVVEQFITAGNDPAARAGVLKKLLLNAAVTVADITKGSEEAIIKQRQTNKGELHE